MDEEANGDAGTTRLQQPEDDDRSPAKFEIKSAVEQKEKLEDSKNEDTSAKSEDSVRNCSESVEIDGRELPPDSTSLIADICIKNGEEDAAPHTTKSETKTTGILQGDVDDSQAKSPSEGEGSPPTADDNLGRRKRKPSRYHDSMFDIPTKLMNINRTINPEEFRAFHLKTAKQKEKAKKVIPAFTSPKIKIAKPELADVAEIEPRPCSTEKPSTSQNSEAHEDDVLDADSMFKFKMRKDHVIQNSVGGPTAYRCDICMMSFPRSFSLRRHYTRRHINPRYVLPKTGNINTNVSENTGLTEKILESNAKGKESKFLYACKMCSKELMYFKHKNDLVTHCQERHNSEPRRPVSVFKCEVCKRSYSTRHELERHKRTHSGERPYACGFCHKTFPTSTNARRHERTHTGDRPHICKVCSKGFIQRTDMVKHLRSIHKMKVTKTKAERADSRKPNRPPNTVVSELGDGRNGAVENRARSDINADQSNQFQENIDFAAYLKLDQHDSGTLMGEKTLGRNVLSHFLGKDKQQNNSNNHQASGSSTSKDLRYLQPSEVVGEDGRPERCHRCPDCSKMFTSNINLRRHHKLKHERNQLYQSAEPVSMVVEKYKIKDEAAGALFEHEIKVNDEQNTKENEEQQPEQSLPNQGLVEEHESDSTNNKDTAEINVDVGIQMNIGESNLQKIELLSNKAPPVEFPPTSPNKRSKGKISKLSSIVQKLADKRSAEQPLVIDDQGDDQSMIQIEEQPIKKLEEMENLMFRHTFLSDNISATSPKKKRRKPTSVQHLISGSPFEEVLAGDARSRLLPEKSHTMPFKRNYTEQTPESSDLSNSMRGPLQQVFRNLDNKISMINPRKSNPDMISRNFDRPSQSSPSLRYINEFHPSVPASGKGFPGYPDMSKSFAPLTSDPFPVVTMPQFSMSRKQGKQDVMQTSRMQTFLSQCWSSKRHDVPQNAILDRNMPVRDTNAMNRMLKYNMRRTPPERINDHLPASAYFSQRDNLTNLSSAGSPPAQISHIFSRDTDQGKSVEGGTGRTRSSTFDDHFTSSGYFSQRDDVSRLSNAESPRIFPRDIEPEKLREGGIAMQDLLRNRINMTDFNTFEKESCNSPLDLRVPSKKVVQDYVVRDDGVLDFSLKTKQGLTTTKTQSRSSNSLGIQPQVKKEGEFRNPDAIFSDERMPLPVPSFDQIPPWLRRGNPNLWNKPSSHMKPPLIPEHRRELLHGRQHHSSRSKRPFKFHTTDFQGPQKHSIHTGYSGNNLRRSVPPHMQLYRDHPYIPPAPPHNLGATMPLSQRKAMPMRIPPTWGGPKQEMPLYPTSSHEERHFSSSPPCSVCNMGPIHRQHLHRKDFNLKIIEPLIKNKSHDSRPLMTSQKNRNWMLNRTKREYAMYGKVQPRPRPIMPKMSHREIADSLLKHKPAVPNAERTPNSISDQVMMNRCIKKAQQALKTEHSSDSERPSSREMVLPVPTPVFKSTVQSLPSYIQKILSTPSGRSDSKSVSTSGAVQLPRVSAFMQKGLIPALEDPIIKTGFHSEMKKTASMSFQDPTSSVINLGSKKLMEEFKKDFTSSSCTEDCTEDSQDVSNRRHILTMTPDLDGSHDDSTEIEKSLVEHFFTEEKPSCKNELSKKEKDEREGNELHSHTVPEIRSAEHLPLPSDHKLSGDQFEHEMQVPKSAQLTEFGGLPHKDLETVINQPARPKSYDSSTLFEKSDLQSYDENFQAADGQHSPNSSSDISCSKSSSPVLASRRLTSKISNRRHTHAHRTHGVKPDTSSHSSKLLKRSSSSDSPHGDALSDESDGTPRKLIKKLKLRVIKSPGSEYWTLVDQDPPKSGVNNCQKMDEELDEGVSMKDHCDDNNEPLQIDVGNEPFAGEMLCDRKMNHLEPKVIITNSNENLKQATENQDDAKTKQTAKSEAECDATKYTMKIEAGQVNTRHDDTSARMHTILTGPHIENALSAIALPSLDDSQQTAVVKGQMDCEEATVKPEDLALDNKENELSNVTEAQILSNCDSNEVVKETCIEETNNIHKEVEVREDDLKNEGQKLEHSHTTPRNDLDNTSSTPPPSGQIPNHSTATAVSPKQQPMIPSTNMNLNGDNYIDASQETMANDVEAFIPSIESSTPEMDVIPAREVEPENVSDGTLSPARTTRSAISNITVTKEISEAKPPCTKTLDTSSSPASASNRLRRSIRIRKTSADKDIAARKKK